MIRPPSARFHQGQRRRPHTKSGSMAAIPTFSPSLNDRLTNGGRPSMARQPARPRDRLRSSRFRTFQVHTPSSSGLSEQSGASTLIALFSGTPWTWNGSWSNLAIITTRIAYTARSMARHPRNVPAYAYLLMPRLVVTLGSSIAAVSSRHQLPLDWQFAPHTSKAAM